MLSWLAEQLGVGAAAVRLAAARASRVQNKASSAAAFRMVVPWPMVESHILRHLHDSAVASPADLRAIVVGLSPASPETDRFSAAWGRTRGVQQEAKTVWYCHQKEHWLGWLEEYDGPGAYGRSTWKRSAEFVYMHVVNPQMLIWLAEAVDVARPTIRLAAKEALSKKSMAAMSAAIRRQLPWELMEPRLISARRRRRSRRTSGGT